MRAELMYNPLMALERIGVWAAERRRLRKLRRTPARGLETGHIDSLELLEILKSSPPKVIYDIGANIGTWSVLVKSVYPEAEVHAFEPLRDHVDAYHAAVQAHGLQKMHVHSTALGSQRSEMRLEIPNRSDAASLLPMTGECKRIYGLETTGSYMVSVHRLEDYCRDHGLPSPDLIKLDVQGYELEVFKGAKEVLRKASAIITEVSFTELYAGQCLFHEIASFLADLGYRMEAFGRGVPLGSPLLQADVLFVNSKRQL